jgi:Stress up-regulated Nod 19
MTTLLRRYRVLALIGLVALIGAACAPLTGMSGTNPTLTVKSYRLGPFNLAAMGTPGSMSQSQQSNIPRPPGDIGIKRMTFDLVDANGTPVPRMNAHLHHVLLMNSAHTSPICANETERFAGAGAERTPMNLWGDYAYHSASTDQWNALWHIMNMTNSPMSIYIQYTVSYLPANDPAASRPVTPFFLDVTGCGTNAEFDVPGNGGPNSVFTKTRTFTAPWSGLAVYSGGHLHDGGISLSIATTGNPPFGCTAVAHYDVPAPMAFPSSISPCVQHDYVTAGTQYRLTARYDNSTPHAAVMGIMLSYLWQGSPPSP